MFVTETSTTLESLRFQNVHMQEQLWIQATQQQQMQAQLQEQMEILQR